MLPQAQSDLPLSHLSCASVPFSLMVEKIQILFIAHYFPPFYYSVMPSEKCVLHRLQMKFCSHQYMVR